MLRGAANAFLIQHSTHRGPIAQEAAPPPPTGNFGYFSLLAFWMGGAGG